MELWRDVIGFECLYQVSNLGSIRSVDRFVRHKHGGLARLKGRIRKPSRNSISGHLNMVLSKDGVKTKVFVHRVVLEAWVGPCPDGCESCHNDGNPTNNSVSNLRWDTHRNNLRDSSKHLPCRNKRVKREDGIKYCSINEAARCNNCSASLLSRVCRGERRTAGGYNWKYC